MNPVDGLGASNLPAHFAQDVEPLAREAENLHLADSLEIRDNSSENPIIAIAGCIGSFLFLTFVALVILPGYLLYKVCHDVYEYLRDSFDGFKRWLYPEETIPEEFHNDPILSQNSCPITYAPIRFPVRDRRHPDHIYEKSAILRWLSRDPRSPLNREAMTPADLVPQDALQAQIEARLRELRQPH